MAAAKGTMPPNAGIGRKAGTPNKNTTALKDMILSALEGAGGVDYLIRQAKAKPAAFLALIGRVLPLNLNHTGTIELASSLEAARKRVMEDEHGYAATEQQRLN